MTQKTVAETRVIQTQLIMPPDINNHNTLYGGNALKLMDSVAGIAFMKHTKATGVTASLDRANFIAPLQLRHTLTIEAIVSGVGTSSVEIFVKVTGDDILNGESYLAVTAFFTFVVLDKSKLPLADIVPETEEEEFILSGYAKRREQRLQVRDEDLEFQRRIHKNEVN